MLTSKCQTRDGQMARKHCGSAQNAGSGVFCFPVAFACSMGLHWTRENEHWWPVCEPVLWPFSESFSSVPMQTYFGNWNNKECSCALPMVIRLSTRRGICTQIVPYRVDLIKFHSHSNDDNNETHHFECLSVRRMTITMNEHSGKYWYIFFSVELIRPWIQLRQSKCHFIKPTVRNEHCERNKVRNHHYFLLFATMCKTLSIPFALLFTFRFDFDVLPPLIIDVSLSFHRCTLLIHFMKCRSLCTI